MKHAFLVLGILMALSVPSHAASGAYSQLTGGCLQYSLKGNVGEYAECLRSVAAVADVLEYWTSDKSRPCIPSDSVANGQLAAVVDRSLGQDHEGIDGSVSARIAAALSNSFPCKK
jgi:hypothetical protein